MTAEIAILNQSAVALAADSAVTITTHVGQKIYNTVNKLFTLSKYHPIGVMVNGSADLMGVPWELSIKMYREQLGDKQFATVRDTAEDFVEWLSSNEELFPVEVRRGFLEQTVGSFLVHLRGQIDGAVKEALSSGPISKDAIEGIVDSVLETVETEIAGFESLVRSSEQFARDALDAEGSPYERLVQQTFEALPMSEGSARRLRHLCELILYKDVFSGQGSSLIVAGFGSTEVFPAIIDYEVDGLFDGASKIAQRSQFRVGVDGSASISPFAQREMVDTFITGIAPDYEQALDGFVSGFMRDLPALIGEKVEDATVRSTVEEAVREVGVRAAEHFADQRRSFTFRRFVDPIVAAVEVLPKEELAEMAEALVNLTSFKRRVSMGEVETVGGPIDVAVISKVDGLVWINRKHYFKPDLNPQFFANYYRNVGEGTKDDESDGR